MKRNIIKLSSITLSLIFIMNIVFMSKASADNSIDLKTNLYGLEEDVKDIEVFINGEDIRNKKVRVNLGVNSLKIDKMSKDYYLCLIRDGRIENFTDVDEKIFVGKEDKEFKFYLVPFDRNINIDIFRANDKYITVYGKPSTEMKYYFRNFLSEESISDVKTIITDEDGIGKIKIDKALNDKDEIVVYSLVDDFLNMANEVVFTLEDTFYNLKLENNTIKVGDTSISGNASNNFMLQITDPLNNKTSEYEVEIDSEGKFKVEVEKIKETDLILARMLKRTEISNFVKLDIEKGDIQIDERISRISGKDRYDTAINISKEIFPKGSRYAIVANGQEFADALVGGTLATQEKAPILLSEKNYISRETLNEINRLNPEKVFILGGINTLSDDVFYEVAGLRTNVERLSGSNRYETAIAIRSKRMNLAPELVYSDNHATMNGYDFADSLTAAPFIGQSYSLSLLPNIENGKPAYMIFGGYSSVPKQEDEGKYEGVPIRYSGKDRFGTAVEVAKAYKPILNKDIDTIVLVDGMNYPDALASAPVSSMNNGAILLTNGNSLNKTTKDYIKSNKNIKNIIIVGGVKSVPSNVEKELEEILN